MSKKVKLFSIILSIVLVIIIGVSALIFAPYKLIIKNDKTGERICSFTVYNDTIFGIEFIHSVNNTPVKDEYIIENNIIKAYKTTYRNFGAGVQTELNEGETLS